MRADSIESVKERVAIATRVLAELGLATHVVANMGHASLRLPTQPDTFAIKGRGYALDALSVMTSADIVLCDLEGRLVEGPEGISQVNEIQMHARIFEARPDINAIVHVHPRHTILMSVLETPIVPMCLEGIHLVQRSLPVYRHAKYIQSVEEGRAVADTLADHPAVLLLGHGATTVGATLDEAVLNMLFLEEQARMNWLALSAFGPQHPKIPTELVSEMIDRRVDADFPHFADSRRDGTSSPHGVWELYSQQVKPEAT